MRNPSELWLNNKPLQPHPRTHPHLCPIYAHTILSGAKHSWGLWASRVGPKRVPGTGTGWGGPKKRPGNFLGPRRPAHALIYY